METGIAAATSVPAIDTEAQKNREQIDRIVYLSSLASRHEDIDSWLNTLRVITANWEPGVALPPESARALDDLEAKLKFYLINKDPLRAFTAKTLEERIHGQARSGFGSIRGVRKSALIIVAVSLFAGALTFILPFELSRETRIYLSTPLALITFHVGIAWLYLTAMRNFKPDVRRMLAFVSASVIALGLAFSYYGIWAVFGQTNPYIQYSGFVGVYFLAYGLMCVGFWLYARLLGIDPRHWILIASLVAGGVAIAFMPHAHSINEGAFTIAAVGTYSLAALNLFGATLAKQIRDKVTEAFARPMTVLMWYMRLVSAGAFIGMIALFILGDIRDTALFISISLGAPVQIAVFYAGYLFKRETGK